MSSSTSTAATAAPTAPVIGGPSAENNHASATSNTLLATKTPTRSTTEPVPPVTASSSKDHTVAGVLPMIMRNGPSTKAASSTSSSAVSTTVSPPESGFKLDNKAAPGELGAGVTTTAKHHCQPGRYAISANSRLEQLSALAVKQDPSISSCLGNDPAEPQVEPPTIRRSTQPLANTKSTLPSTPASTITAATVATSTSMATSTTTGSSSIMEFKTYRSPPRNKNGNNSHHDEEVPSLCSINSSGGAPTSTSTTTAGHNKDATAGQSCTTTGADKTPKTMIPTTSISVDPNKQDNPSPLASHDSSGNQHNMRATTPPRSMMDMHKGPARSPAQRKGFDSLPALEDTKQLTSPGGLFLSPNPPTPFTLRKDSFEEKKRDDDDDDGNDFEGKPSPRGGDRQRYVATPTDFALDYGKGHSVSGSFDTSNVLAWLQSPTANGLFSPGGLGSIMNTPAGGACSSGMGGIGAAAAAAAAASRTPRTPTVCTSFFFSDVASLPRNENVSPKGGAMNGDASGSKRSQKGLSNIICISPLASRKPGNGTMSTSNTPMNFKDVFASPKARGSLPLLSDTPSKEIRVPQRSGSKDPSLDAHLAERDLMEDEDLSVLLQLASNTPGPSGRCTVTSSGIGGPVFRSPNRRKNGDGDDGNLPGLQLPMIGNTGDASTKTRLTQKSSRSRDMNDPDDFAPPQLGMRSSSSHGAKKENNNGKSDLAKQGDAEPVKRPKKVPRKSHYQMPQYPPLAHDTHYYPSMTGSMSLPPGLNVPPGPQGTMRVIMGGPPPPPPPTSGVSKGSPPRHGPPHPYHDYPPPPSHGQASYPPPLGMSGMYQAYPPYGGISRYPPYAQYPPPGPPRHMHMYGAPQQSQDTAIEPKKSKAKQPKAVSAKRPAPAPAPSAPLVDGKPVPPAKKQKKSPNVQPKKKNKSPQLTDGAERRQAAATIHAVNSASGGKNDKAAALAAAILRGVTMRPSGKWQAQLYFAGKSRYIGVFDNREKAALAYEIAREKLKSGKEEASVMGGLNPKSTENLVNAARKAAFEGVNEKIPK